LRERAKRRWGSLEPVSLATCTPFAEKRCTASKFAKRDVGLQMYLDLSKWARDPFGLSITVAPQVIALAKSDDLRVGIMLRDN